MQRTLKDLQEGQSKLVNAISKTQGNITNDKDQLDTFNEKEEKPSVFESIPSHA